MSIISKLVNKIKKRPTSEVIEAGLEAARRDGIKEGYIRGMQDASAYVAFFHRQLTVDDNGNVFINITEGGPLALVATVVERDGGFIAEQVQPSA